MGQGSARDRRNPWITQTAHFDSDQGHPSRARGRAQALSRNAIAARNATSRLAWSHRDHAGSGSPNGTTRGQVVPMGPRGIPECALHRSLLGVKWLPGSRRRRHRPLPSVSFGGGEWAEPTERPTGDASTVPVRGSSWYSGGTAPSSSGQDPSLSRWWHGFESRRGHPLPWGHRSANAVGGPRDIRVK